MYRLVQRPFVRGFVIAGLLAMSLGVHADTLQMPAEPEPTPVTEPTPTPVTEMAIQLPGRGMSMEKVEEKFGPPIEKVEPVGTPPISRWIYHSFTVYFESDRVIHSVVNKQ